LLEHICAGPLLDVAAMQAQGLFTDAPLGPSERMRKARPTQPVPDPRLTQFDSDIDLFVEFDGPATPDRYFGVQFYLEDLLGREVDLVTKRALRPQLRPCVEREAITIA